MIPLPRQNPWHALAAGSLSLLTLALIYLLLMAPAIHQRMTFRDRLDDLRFHYARYATVLKNMDNIGSELDSLRAAASGNDGFLDDKPAALAAADLQNYLQELIEARGGILISTQILPETGKEIFPAVTVKVQMRCGIEALRNLMLDLETGQLYVQVNNLFLQGQYQPAARNIRRRQPIPDTGMIEVRFDLSAYIYQSGAGKE